MTAHTDLEKLRVLVPHWIAHNCEHAGEFRDWAKKAQAIGNEEAADYIMQAARQMEQANDMLAAALEKLGGALESHHH